MYYWQKKRAATHSVLLVYISTYTILTQYGKENSIYIVLFSIKFFFLFFHISKINA